MRSTRLCLMLPGHFSRVLKNSRVLTKLNNALGRAVYFFSILERSIINRVFTWKFVSFQPGFLARTLIRTCDEVVFGSRPFTSCHQNPKSVNMYAMLWNSEHSFILFNKCPMYNDNSWLLSSLRWDEKVI